MKRTNVCFAVALSAALAMGTMAGCGSQSASSESAPAESTAEPTEATPDAAPTDVEQSQDEIIAELKAAVANPFAYKSVTINETVNPLTKGEEEAAGDEAVSSKGVYKFDASGDKLRTSMEATVSDVTLTYYTEGNDAVVVTDGPVYSGTTEELGLAHFDGVEAYMTDSFGDLQSIVDCVDTVTKEQQGDVTVYTLTVDPQKYIESDEILSMMAEYGDPLQSATFTFGFDQDGRMVSAEEKAEYSTVIAQRAVTLSDFDTTVVDPMPEADRTYSQMEEDEQLKLDAFAKQIEGEDEAENADSSADAAETE